MVTFVEDIKSAELQDPKPVSTIPFFAPEGSVDYTSDAAFRADPKHVFLEGYRRFGPVFVFKLFLCQSMH